MATEFIFDGQATDRRVACLMPAWVVLVVLHWADSDRRRTGRQAAGQD